MSHDKRKDIAIVVAGQAGQGISTIEFVLTRILKRSGYHVFATKEYMSRIRGGSNSTLIRVSRDGLRAYVDRIDVLVPLDGGSLRHLSERISEKTLIIGEKDKLDTEHQCVDVPFTVIAEAAGGKIYINTVAIAVLSGLLQADQVVFEEFLADYFSSKGTLVVNRNLEAAKEGYILGAGLRNSLGEAFRIDRHVDTGNDLLISGGEAVALGAISGGCDFVASYPMSPSTAVLTYLSQHDRLFGIVVEQAEDEIAAVNMAIGAWYAGARAMVTTSGGGFALMGEGVSLAGITESPMVIHLAQRPGPATGMATRTEQADLLTALYAGHGEFPRIIYAPGTMEDAFTLTGRAFDMADRYQVPVFILTDQYLIDSYYDFPALDAGGEDVKHLIRTDPAYKRYAMTEDGVSPRGIPGFGEGIVVVDSHEHTEEGRTTEAIPIRNRMTQKRMSKLDLIRDHCVEPLLVGPGDYEYLVIGWGSNFHILEEAVSLLRREDLSLLHFSQVYPLPPSTLEYLRRAGKTILVENNFSGQFGRLLRSELLFDVDHRISQYDGRPICSERLAREILKTIGRRATK